MVAFGLFVFLQWSFDRGFFNYISRETLSGLSDFGTMVTGYYDKQTGWASLKNNQGLWLELHGGMLENYRKNGIEDKENGRRLPPPPPPHDPEWIGSRVVLLDAEKNT